MTKLTEQAFAWMRYLCLEIPGRVVGSPGNRAATDFFAETVAARGFQVEQSLFDCMDWSGDGAALVAGGVQFPSQISPYSAPCRAVGRLAVVQSVEALESADVSGQIVLLCGEIAKEPLMPKNFPFYNPDEHRRIIAALEQKAPQALIAATGQHPEMAGALYPFPLFEDGDFAIPSVFMTDVDGDRLAEYDGCEVTLTIHARRTPATGYNVIARKGTPGDQRVIVFAHIDAKSGTPGAIDNAGGVVTLLLLAELLKDYTGDTCIELVAMNGEDYYSNPGEQKYLNDNADRFGNILLGINLDGLGYQHGRTAYSLYGCSDEMTNLIRTTFANYPQLAEGEAWYQGDHGLFLMNERPALALTSEHIIELMARVVHTDEDRPDIVNLEHLLVTAEALGDLIQTTLVR